MAASIGASPHQVAFTSGATEANNAAIQSALLNQPEKRHIVVSAVEHSAVLAYCEHLTMHAGIEVTRLPVDCDGGISLDGLRTAIRSDTALVSLMWANNETGVIWPVKEIAGVCADRNVALHSDAVQAVGKIPVDFAASGVSFLSLSGHKFGAPKGIGALVMADPDSFVPLIVGGKQENGRRGGTENVSYIVALGIAIEIASSRGTGPWNKIAALRDQFEEAALKDFSGAHINGNRNSRLPNTSSIRFPGMDADALVTFLDQRGICVSSGSACLESSMTPSHVIQAMTGSYDWANESLRISLGLTSTENELQQLLSALEAFAVANA